MQWIDVCSSEDLQPNSGICALVAGKQVAIFYMLQDERIYALGNYDPIGKANVLSRGLIGDINGEPVVASPLYKQHFSLYTGQCIEDQNVQVEAFAVRKTGGRVEIGV